jgi:hypothetical protein
MDIKQIDPNISEFSGKDKGNIEFGKLFRSETRDGDSMIDGENRLEPKNKYTLYSLSNHCLNFCQRVYMQMPFYADAIKIKQGLVINKGVVYSDPDEQETFAKNRFVDGVLDEFIESFGGNMFLGELIRVLENKGNAIVTLVKDNDKNKFMILDPSEFFVVTKSDKESIAGYTAVAYGYKNKKEYTLLPNATTIPIWTTPKSVLGVPKATIQQDLTLAILAETEEYKIVKQNKGFQKTILTAYTTQAGDKTMATPEEVAKLSNDINKLASDPTRATTIVNKEFDQKTLPTIDINNSFWADLETKAMIAANMVGIPSQMLLSGKNINRTNADQAYKVKIQSNIQPMNNYLSSVIQEMAKIWCEAEGKTPIINVTIDNPKQNLDLDIGVKDMLELIKMGVLTAEEVKKLLNLNN